jgi:hypothetical protein
MNQQQFEDGEQRLDADTVRRVIDRAAELQKAHLETVSTDQLEALASEVGISPEFVRRALSETETAVASEPTQQMVTVRRKVVRKKAPLAGLAAKDIRTALTPGILYALFAGIAVNTTLGHNNGADVILLLVQPLILTAYFAQKQPHRRMGALVGLSYGMLPILIASMFNPPWQGVPAPAALIYGPMLAVLGFGTTAAKKWWVERQNEEVIEEIVTEPAR